MRAVLDTNVLLDVLLDRKPFSVQSAQVLSKVERGELNGYACATSVTTIFYLCSRQCGRRRARRHVETLLSILDVAPVNRRVIDAALVSRFADFEDAVLSESAALVSAEVIVTRNKRDFVAATVPTYSPAELLRLLGSDALPKEE